MIQDNILLIISLLLGVSMLAMLSDKLRISYPIFLVVSGLFISIIPGIPDIQLQPDLVFLIFLPPLLYAAAWNTSWKDFWKWKRPISLLAFGLVITTACGVAFFSSYIIPNFGLAFGFLLGGIISPPDAVAATTVMQELKLPKRIVTILEGESLVNDAASLIVFRFALAAILIGNFNIWKAEANFLYVVALGVLIGIAIGFVIYSIHRYLPTTPSIDTAVSLMTPYIMYIAAEHFHSSGVLAVVSGGLFLTYRSQDIFSYSSRLQMQHVWDTVVFMLNGVVFILIGLQLRSIINGIQEYSIIASIGYALLITLLVIVIRIAWIFPNTYIPRLLSKKIRTTEPKPTWQNVLIVGWSGMRGVVSLASGLAIPLTLSDKTPFPHRDLILFITFILILVTLVFQGLTLPWLIKILKVHSEEDESQLELAVRLRLAEASLEHMDSHYSELADNDAYIRVKERYARMIDIAGKRLNMETNAAEAPAFLPKYRQMLIDLVAIKRNELNKMRHNNSFPDELIRKKELELDLEEARLHK
ncbi:Na+/H+ antiporter [Pinibacter aurantiacus]|uniref:Na+/H+ antiporter n=1 Tax=Pinibacter aurantiacus TaxID=2851599 RepID=A0A9E2W906_9BACT|nr:Na+/H+ antiporter [Pinibacter aurantiacus]MBV4359311.1 Na+/H+ antiporter [Pinibacter aurantiacus]